MMTDAQGWLVTLWQQKAEKKEESSVGIENLKVTQPLVTLTLKGFATFPDSAIIW